MPTAPASPEACDRLFVEHVNAGDVNAVLSLYEPACRMVRRDGSVAQGHAEIREVLERLIGMRPRMTTEIVKVVTTGDLAMVYNDWRLSGKRPDGQRVEAVGKAIEVVRRQPDGTWRFILDDPFARG
ncbi:MAG TPA: SgcJ/EcaC family oxidoreductase [Methylomirabilota bacterium]|nr:SgcJ/EcaC family oxidoreductase [Methylomirabilota bacterium]